MRLVPIILLTSGWLFIAGAVLAYQYTKVYTYSGQMLAATADIDEFGLEITLPLMLYIDSIPAGEFYT